MKKFVCLVASGLLEIRIIQNLDIGIFMAFSQFHIGIFAVKRFRTLSAQICEIAHIAWLIRLSAAVDAAAGAGHNLNKVIVGFA